MSTTPQDQASYKEGRIILRHIRMVKLKVFEQQPEPMMSLTLPFFIDYVAEPHARILNPAIES
jgi:hypothetical protein